MQQNNVKQWSMNTNDIGTMSYTCSQSIATSRYQYVRSLLPPTFIHAQLILSAEPLGKN